MTIPQELLDKYMPSSIETTAMTTVDSNPDTWAAVAYALKCDEEDKYITVVYDLSSGKKVWYLETPVLDRVTCVTMPTETLAIVGTSIGSIHVFDLTEGSVYS